jgi:hypothetical protein
MAKALSAIINNQISKKAIGITFTFTINNLDFSSYLMPNWSGDTSKEFGSSSAVFTLNNNDSQFGSGGRNEIKVGDLIEFVENYTGDTTNWGRFYGVVTQRSIGKSASNRTITINCLDYISVLQNWDIDLEVEGTKTEVTNETLTPNYLPAPNDDLAQLFDFANDSLADNPLPIIMIRDTVHSTDDPQYDGFEIRYDVGQLKLGSPLNAKNNYSIIARSYYFYNKGVYAEDVLEDILTLEDGYGNYLFGESSAQEVIDNHLTTNYYIEEGNGAIDAMTPNYTSSTITIETTLTADVSAGTTSINVTSTDGFPTTGSGTINGDTFTWGGKTGTSLTGIPATGSNALKAHADGSYVEYEATYSAGQVWYLDYSNVQTTLTSGDFTIGGGGTFNYLDKRNGRIILTSAISTSSSVTCDSNYSFKTLQATGIEINYIRFKPRELNNAFEAINKLRNYLSPNYIIRTQGDKRIWSSYLSQKSTADYDLELIRNINYLEDEDLYTRVIFYGKNKNPTNIMFKDGVDFVTTGETYKSLASASTLAYLKEEGNYWVYKSLISDAGYIDLEQIKPIVYIDDVPVNDTLHQMVALPVTVAVKTKTTTKTGCHGISKEQYVKVHTYYYYKVKLPHTNIEPSQPIYLYDATGALQYTLSAYDLNMDYARGIWSVPGNRQNSIVETLSTATYYVFYSTKEIIIDYDNVYFKISKSLIPNTDQSVVKATFEYWTVMTAVHEVAAIIDGRWDTQCQTEFFAEPPSGYNYGIIDLGATYSIQAIDLVAGFYRPDSDGVRKFDIDFRFTIQYSTNGSDYYNISGDTHNVSLVGGDSVSFEEEELGTDFQARYLKIILENVSKIDYRNGVWVVAFAELSAYNDIVLKSTSTLISTTTLNGALSGGEGTITVVSTDGFDSDGTLYLNAGGTTGNADDAVTYTGKTDTTFTGCSGVQAQSNSVRVSQTLETDTTLYDDNGLLPKLGDRVYKEIKISDEYLFTQADLDYLTKRYLKEFHKNHQKLSVDVAFAPYLKIGQTVNLNDTYNNITNVKYFIESIADRGNFFNLVLARYP